MKGIYEVFECDVVVYGVFECKRCFEPYLKTKRGRPPEYCERCKTFVERKRHKNDYARRAGLAVVKRKKAEEVSAGLRAKRLHKEVERELQAAFATPSPEAREID